MAKLYSSFESLVVLMTSMAFSDTAASAMERPARTSEVGCACGPCRVVCCVGWWKIWDNTDDIWEEKQKKQAQAANVIFEQSKRQLEKAAAENAETETDVK